MPDSGAYIALVGTLSNFTNKDSCVNGDDFRLLSDSGNYAMDGSTLEAAKALFHIDYPGFFLGQCLDYDESVQSFLIFDANPYVYVWLRMQGAEAALGAPLAISSMLVRPTATALPPQAATVGQLSTAPQPSQPLAVVYPTATPSNLLGTVGQPSAAAGIAIVVAGVFQTDNIGGLFTPDPGYTYLAIDVLVKNIGRDEAPYNPLYFSVQDSQGYQYNGLLYAPEPALRSGESPQGGIARGNVAFEIPTNASGLVVTYEPMVFFAGYEPIRIALGR